MSMVHMGSVGRKWGGAVGVKILVLRIGLLFILNSVRGDSEMMGRVLGKESMGSDWSNISITAGEDMSHRNCNIFIFWY